MTLTRYFCFQQNFKTQTTINFENISKCLYLNWIFSTLGKNNVSLAVQYKCIVIYMYIYVYPSASRIIISWFRSYTLQISEYFLKFESKLTTNTPANGICNLNSLVNSVDSEKTDNRHQKYWSHNIDNRPGMLKKDFLSFNI